jgi:pantothenate synthetase
MSVSVRTRDGLSMASRNATAPPKEWATTCAVVRALSAGRMILTTSVRRQGPTSVSAGASP